jgi:hypothetical protein
MLGDWGKNTGKENRMGRETCSEREGVVWKEKIFKGVVGGATHDMVCRRAHSCDVRRKMNASFPPGD